MKAFKIFSLVAIVLMLVTSACENLDTIEHLRPLNPANVDANAGSWTMILPITNNQFASSVPTPAATTAPAYINELTAVKNAQARLTSSQRKAVEYWGAGGVLRWNQIMRELVAKYALPPAPSENGTYPLPIPENPWGDPAFP